LPGVAKALGQSLKIFKNEVKGLSDDPKPTDKDAPKDEPGDGSAPKA
jgi:Sec-independent protein translocase protein TatA